MKIDGGCHCGEIAYEAELDPEKVAMCHCTDCQTLSASAFRTVAMVPGNSFKLTRGEPRIYIKTGESGRRRIQAFCGTCGTGLYSAPTDDPAPEVIILRAGSIHQRDQLVPRRQVWHRSALPWMRDAFDIEAIEKNPW